MEDQTLDERQLRIVKRLQQKHSKPDPDSITLDKTTRKEIKYKLFAVIGLFLLSGGYNAYTLMQNSSDKALLKTEITALTQQVSSYKQQIKELDLKQHQTEDRRYQAQRKLNRTTEQLAVMQGNTKEAKAMLQQLQILLK